MSTEYAATKGVVPFLLLPENRLAHAAVSKLKPPKRFQKGKLLFLYGASGVGKSHLVQLFQYLFPANKKSSDTQKSRFLSLTASQFVADYTEFAEQKLLHEYREQFDDLDILICEDVNILKDRKEFANFLTVIIDEIFHRGGRLLFTSCQSPGSLKGLPRQLVNRFHGGTAIQVELPGCQSRLKLLTHFASTKQLAISTNILKLIAEELPVSPRELLSVLIQLEGLAKVRRKKEVDETLVRQFLEGEIKPKQPSLSQITKTVAKQFEVSVAAIRSKTQKAETTQPRQCAMLLARHLTSHSLRKIADYFGRRNHSTVIHACQRIQKLIQQEPVLQLQLSQILHSLEIIDSDNSSLWLKTC
ncbi:Chromosomal replication initiator protein DnaA [hydrothermal vent metagenome]|uniref:Chromosomal replication initiator protein DnaA n=1 Tax=hydrothermal vent metagenome TaxID=652676 RepID=A0A3B1DXQ3_9ZZZZ